MERVFMTKSVYSNALKLIVLGSFLMSTTSQAAGPNFFNLSEKDFENISKEFSGDLMHHSVQGAATLGSILGFEVGLIAGQTSSPDLSKISKDSGGEDVPNLYHAGLLGVLTVPFGITGELIMLPKTSANDTSLQMTSAALKFTMSEELLVIPFNLALRGFMSSSKVSFTQTDATGTATVENDNKVTGLQLLVSPKLPVFEPYAGVGMVNAKNTLSTTGTLLFDPTYTASQSQDSTLSSTQILLGVTANLLFFRLGAEYSSAFGNNSTTVKLAVGF